MVRHNDSIYAVLDSQSNVIWGVHYPCVLTAEDEEGQQVMPSANY
jgi:hypothetical protein